MSWQVVLPALGFLGFPSIQRTSKRSPATERMRLTLAAAKQQFLMWTTFRSESIRCLAVNWDVMIKRPSGQMVVVAEPVKSKTLCRMDTASQMADVGKDTMSRLLVGPRHHKLMLMFKCYVIHMSGVPAEVRRAAFRLPLSPPPSACAEPGGQSRITT